MIMKLIRRLTQCSRGIHWRMIYDSGLANDFSSPGTCSDCGYKSEGFKCPPRPKVNKACEEISTDLFERVIQAIEKLCEPVVSFKLSECCNAVTLSVDCHNCNGNGADMQGFDGCPVCSGSGVDSHVVECSECYELIEY